MTSHILHTAPKVEEPSIDCKFLQEKVKETAPVALQRCSSLMDGRFDPCV